MVGSPAALCAVAGSNPTPSSMTSKVTSPPWTRSSRSRTSVADACLMALRSPLGQSEDELFGGWVEHQEHVVREFDPHGNSAAARGGRKVGDGGGQTGGLQGCGIDVHQQRTQAADIAAHRFGRVDESMRLVRTPRTRACRAPPARLKDVAASSWTTPSCKVPAIRRRSVSDASSAACKSEARCSCSRWSRR